MQRKEKSPEWTLEKKTKLMMGIMQEILRKSTGFLRRIIAPVGGR